MARVTRWKRATTSARWTTDVVTWKIHGLSRETASTFCAIPLNTYSNTYSNSIRGSITSPVGTLQGRLSTPFPLEKDRKSFPRRVQRTHACAFPCGIHTGERSLDSTDSQIPGKGIRCSYSFLRCSCKYLYSWLADIRMPCNIDVFLTFCAAIVPEIHEKEEITTL